MERNRAASFVPALLAVCVLFAFLGTRGLNEPDEGRYAEIGREMAGGAGWLVPHLNGFEHFQKPPLLYWMTAAAIKLFGVNEWAARLPSALCALCTLWFTFYIGRLLFNRTSAIAATLVLLSSGEFLLMARLLTPDMMLTFWITATIAALVKFTVTRERKWSWLFFVAMGLGFLTKGPMALVVPVSAAVVLRLRVRKGEGSLPPPALPWFRGIVLTLAIGLSWFVVLCVNYPELYHYFAGYELVQRFASHAHGRSKPFWYFVPVLLAGMLPWSCFFPALGAVVWRRWRDRAPLEMTHRLLLGWVVPPFVVLSLSGSKLPTYVLPLLPALALALGHWWSRSRSQRVLMGIAAGSMAVFLICISLATRFNDRLAQQATVRPLAQTLKAVPGLDKARVFVCGARAHGLEFYLQRVVSATKADSDIVFPPNAAQSARVITNASDFAQELKSGQPSYGVVRTQFFEKVFPQDRWHVLGRSGDFLLISNQP